MINLFIFLLCLSVNFGTIEFPMNYTPVNNEFISIYTRCWENIVSIGYNLDPDIGILVDRSGGNGSSYGFFYPAEAFNGSQSSISCNGRNNSEINVVTTNWYRWICNSDGYPISGPSIVNIGSVGFYDYDNNSYTRYENIIYNGYYLLTFNGIDTFSWETEVVPIGSGSGSLSPSGHSSGGSPLEELNNNGVTWSSTQGDFTVAGHSIQNVTTPPSADPNSNLELILSGFLGGILNNTNDILGNTSQIGVVLGGVSNNVIQGASAVFNAISNINDTIMGFIEYIREPLDQDRISDKLEEVPIYQTINSLVGFSDSFLSAINSIQDPEHLYLTMDFRNANEPFRRLGLYVFDFTFLDNLKSTWQPILLAVLYVTLGVNIFYDLPNIVHGISGLSGGDE